MSSKDCDEHPDVHTWDHKEFVQRLSCISDVPGQSSFSGSFKTDWADGVLKATGDYHGGKRKGIHIGYRENGEIRDVAAWKDGFVVGTMLRFRQNGTLQEEYFFGDGGQQPRHYIHRLYNASEDLVCVRQIEGQKTLHQWGTSH